MFNLSLGQIIEGLALLISVGFNGLLLLQHKTDKASITYLEERNSDQVYVIGASRDRIIELEKNQKPVPWNKGKKGYKLPRTKKVEVKPDRSMEMAANSEANKELTGFVHSWENIV